MGKNKDKIMGYTLRPKNKKIKSIDVGAFSWPILLQETGAGYVLGYGAGITPASYVYQSGNNGSPASNDGYIVNSDQAKTMSVIIDGFISVQRFNIIEFEKETIERKQYMRNNTEIYKIPWHSDRLDQLQVISDFMKVSKGFRIF